MLSSDGGWSRFAREDGGRNAVSGGFRAVGSMASAPTMLYLIDKWQRWLCRRRHGRARGSRLPGGMRVRILRYTSNRKRRWPENLAGMRAGRQGKVGAPIHRVKPWKERFR